MSSADGPEEATPGETSLKTTLPANIRFPQIAAQEKQRKPAEQMEKLSPCKAQRFSAPVFIFTASLVLSELRSGQNTDGAGRRIRRR